MFALGNSPAVVRTFHCDHFNLLYNLVMAFVVMAGQGPGGSFGVCLHLLTSSTLGKLPWEA
jgi:hypothetical protein